jgi:hypothetical protein
MRELASLYWVDPQAIANTPCFGADTLRETLRGGAKLAEISATKRFLDTLWS